MGALSGSRPRPQSAQQFVHGGTRRGIVAQLLQKLARPRQRKIVAICQPGFIHHGSLEDLLKAASQLIYSHVCDVKPAFLIIAILFLVRGADAEAGQRGSFNFQRQNFGFNRFLVRRVAEFSRMAFCNCFRG